MCNHVAMLKFLGGILLIQGVTVLLVLVAPDSLHGLGWLRLIVPIFVIGFFAAFWFAAISKHHRQDAIASLQQRHAREREKIRVNAERAKTRLVKETQKQISREARVTHARANFKVGASFAGVIALGALMLLTEFLTLGVMIMTTAGGALGGYLYRGRREKLHNMQDVDWLPNQSGATQQSANTDQPKSDLLSAGSSLSEETDTREQAAVNMRSRLPKP